MSRKFNRSTKVNKAFIIIRRMNSFRYTTINYAVQFSVTSLSIKKYQFTLHDVMDTLSTLSTYTQKRYFKFYLHNYNYL